MTATIEQRIKRMNEVFDLPSPLELTDHGNERIHQFYEVLNDEVLEIKDVVGLADSDERFVAYADVLADIVVYAYSEARRWGIPLDKVVHVVLDSQDSKLVNGKAVMSEDGSKFIKGPHYVAPEAKIAELLKGFK